jgi:hypothetical protein
MAVTTGLPHRIFLQHGFDALDADGGMIGTT